MLERADQPNRPETRMDTGSRASGGTGLQSRGRRFDSDSRLQ